MGEISAVQVVGAVIFAVIGGFAWWLQERMPSEHAALFSWIVLLVFSAASVEVASSPFAWELITRAADITVHSTYSTSYMAILRDVLVFLYVVLRIWRREEGRQAVLKHWDNAKNAFEGLVILFAATFLYHLAITVPQEIGKEANNVPQPSFERNSSNPPRIAYVKTPILHVPKIRDEVVLHPYDLSDSRRETKFLALLKPGES